MENASLILEHATIATIQKDSERSGGTAGRIFQFNQKANKRRIFQFIQKTLTDVHLSLLMITVHFFPLVFMNCSKQHGHCQFRQIHIPVVFDQLDKSQ
jgi:hypothetical protein